MLLTIIKSIIGVFAAVQAGLLSKMFIKGREPVDKKTNALFWGMGVIMNFFDYLGVGSFAPTLAIYRLTKTVDDDLIPGTLVTGCALPVAIEALVSLSVIDVELTTLFSMYGTGILGAFIGGKWASKLEVKTIQRFMGFALIIAAAIMLLGKLNLMPVGGDAIGLHGTKLVIAAVGSFILAALLTVGIGNYAPTMVLVYLLGMSPAVSFPIMMGLGFLGVGSGSFPYFKSERFHKRASFAFAMGGIFGVLAAVFIIVNMPISALQWLVIAVCCYTSVTLLRDGFKNI
ncbi:MAG: sulfite exporter TauE/SafE family protein [Clostridiales bacterium]|nr:sulfite exporter TauE/SafE family protein [Clostridiales bacterium]